MKQKFTYLALLVAALFTTQGAWAQTNGDYQTHTGGPGNWNNTASWEFYSGGWVTPAPAIPNANTGLLTIKDNITLDVSVTISHAIVQNNATFSVNQTGGITLTIAKSAATNDLEITSGSTLVLGDIVPTGDEHIEGSGASPSIIIDNGGFLTFNSGFLDVITTVNGGGTATLTTVNSPKNVGANFTNNGTMTWNSGPSAGGLQLTGATFTNGGTLIENFSSDRGFINGGSSSIINAGIFTKSTTHQILTNQIPITNSGTIQGMGTVDFGGSTFTNAGSGILAPGAANGSSVAVLNVTPNAITGNATTLKINITGASNTPGTDFSQMVSIASGTGNAPLTPDIDLSNATLTLVDAGTGPATTVYTILDAGTGNITGNFATTNVTSNYTIAVNPHTVTATKNTVLPITWGPFDALVQHDNTVLLDWTTYLESNTSHFVVDYSTDGKVFNSIGTVTAAGNSSTTLQYSFKHTTPNLNGTNFYRLQEVDRDGKSNYSPVRVVRFANAQALKVLVLPNPVHDQLQMTVQEQNITASLYSGDGRLLRTWRLQPGTQQVNIGDLPAGNYQLMVSQKDQQIETQHLIKL